MYLARLNTLEEASEQSPSAKEELQQVEDDFRQMLEENRPSLDYKTTVNLIAR